MRELVISKYEAGQRFDKFLAKYMELAPKQFVSIAQKRGLGTWEHGIPEV